MSRVSTMGDVKPTTANDYRLAASWHAERATALLRQVEEGAPGYAARLITKATAAQAHALLAQWHDARAKEYLADLGVDAVSDIRTIYVEGKPWRIFARRFGDAPTARAAVTTLMGQGRNLGVYRTASNVVIVVTDIPSSASWAAGMIEGDTYLGVSAAEEKALVLRRMDAIDDLRPVADALQTNIGVRTDHGAGVRIDKLGHTVKSSE